MACLVCSSVAWAEPPATPQDLSPLVRSLLKRRMEQHGQDMLRLVKSVVLLDRAQTQRLAAQIASEPRLTRPLPGDADELNRGLPERFFVLQDELRARAKALSADAAKADDGALTARLHELLQTCVSCHRSFLPAQAEVTP